MNVEMKILINSIWELLCVLLKIVCLIGCIIATIRQTIDWAIFLLLWSYIIGHQGKLLDIKTGEVRE